MAIDSNPLGGLKLTGEDAAEFRGQMAIVDAECDARATRPDADALAEAWAVAMALADATSNLIKATDGNETLRSQRQAALDVLQSTLDVLKRQNDDNARAALAKYDAKGEE